MKDTNFHRTFSLRNTLLKLLKIIWNLFLNLKLFFGDQLKFKDSHLLHFHISFFVLFSSGHNGVKSVMQCLNTDVSGFDKEKNIYGIGRWI